MPYVGRQPTPSPVTADDIPANSIDASKIPDTVEADLKSGRKNIFINGAFGVSQRGYSSATAVSDNDYTLDRWKMRTEGASATVQQTAVTPWTGKTTNAIKVVATSTANGYHNIRQIVEDYKIVSGQTVTLSAWVRGSGNPLFFRHWGVTNIGSGKALTSSWQKYTETYNVPALSNTTDGNSGSFTMALGNYNGYVSITSGDWYEVALLQVELGSQATDFEHRSYGEELALCQRYYERWSKDTANDRSLLGGGWGGVLIGQMFFQKRDTPTLSHSNAEIRDDANLLKTITSVACGKRHFNLYCSGETFKTGNLRMTSGGYIDFDAEL